VKATRTLLTIVFLGVLVPSVLAAAIGFPTSSWMWFYEGAAHYDSVTGAIVIVPETGWVAGRAVPLLGIPSGYGWFNFSFEYRIVDTGSGRADGFVFAFFADLSSLPSIDSVRGGAEGFGSARAWGIEFDEYQNGFDPSAPHIALINASVEKHVAYNTSVSEAFVANVWHLCNVSIHYTGTEMTVIVYIDRVKVLSATVTNPVIYGHFVFFSAGTGGDYDGFEIRNFTVFFQYIPPINATTVEEAGIESFSASVKPSTLVIETASVAGFSASVKPSALAIESLSLARFSSSVKPSTLAIEGMSIESTRVLYPRSCLLVDLLTNSTILEPVAPWLNTSLRYRLPILVLANGSDLGNELAVEINSSEVAGWLLGNGTAYLAIDNESVDGTVYVINRSLVYVLFTASLPPWSYAYLYIYFGNASGRRVVESSTLPNASASLLWSDPCPSVQVYTPPPPTTTSTTSTTSSTTSVPTSTSSTSTSTRTSSSSSTSSAAVLSLSDVAPILILVAVLALAAALSRRRHVERY